LDHETLRIFDEHNKPLGTATRKEVHKKGYWHETFHCWAISKEDGIDYLHLQIRSQMKKDYPNLLDITAAGHILSNETVHDGIREVKEELGLQVSFEELVPLGLIKYSVEHEGLNDKELAHNFLFFNKYPFEKYKLQKEEVSGIVKIDFTHFSELWLGERDEVRIIGFECDHADNRKNIDKFVSKQHFVPHEISYYKTIIKLISNHI
jgi:isopentenyldiphosphate isomerase